MDNPSSWYINFTSTFAKKFAATISLGGGVTVDISNGTSLIGYKTLQERFKISQGALSIPAEFINLDNSILRNTLRQGIRKSIHDFGIHEHLVPVLNQAVILQSNTSCSLKFQNSDTKKCRSRLLFTIPVLGVQGPTRLARRDDDISLDILDIPEIHQPPVWWPSLFGLWTSEFICIKGDTDEFEILNPSAEKINTYLCYELCEDDFSDIGKYDFAVNEESLSFLRECASNLLQNEAPNSGAELLTLGKTILGVEKRRAERLPDELYRVHQKLISSFIFRVLTLNPNDYQGAIDVTSELLVFEECYGDLSFLKDIRDDTCNALAALLIEGINRDPHLSLQFK